MTEFKEGSLGLRGAIEEVMQIQGLNRKGLLNRIIPQNNPHNPRWAVYRLLQGKTLDPRMSTIVAISDALRVPPGKFVELAYSVVGSEEYHKKLAEIRLEGLAREIEGQFPFDLQELVSRQAEGLVKSAEDWVKSHQ